MKILTITGTRPELIRLSLIIKKLDNLVNHVLVYTNQNYDANLSTIFFNQLQIRKPNYYFKKTNTIGEFLSNGFLELEFILQKENPDKVLILGDTNSSLLCILCRKYNIPIYHMEAGNRCYNNNVPEENNRILIDNFSTYNLPYTENSKNNLLLEGFNRNYVLKTGNPIYEVLLNYEKDINNSNILDILNIQKNDYVLVTSHRAENVDNEVVLSNILKSLIYISDKIKIVFSVHPRTREKIYKSNIKLNNNIIISKPFSFFDFIKLEKNCKLTITDSGTVQEELSIFNKPCLIIRDKTERQELLETGTNILCGTNYDNIVNCFNNIDKLKFVENIPQDYKINNVSDIVINILMST